MVSGAAALKGLITYAWADGKFECLSASEIVEKPLGYKLVLVVEIWEILKRDLAIKGWIFASKLSLSP